MTNSETIPSRLETVRTRLERACAESGRRNSSVALLAVSKTRGADEIAALRQLGIAAFGENYVDEACRKQDELIDFDQPIEWHFIGPIQSNKTRRIAERFDWVQSVDRVKIARRLSEQRPEDRAPLNVLIQVNIDGESQKAGCTLDTLDALADVVVEQPRLMLRGLMAIPAPRESAEAMRPVFARMRQCFDQLANRIDSVDTLSMGMSSDLEPAVAEGATLIRIGTALFGPRPSQTGPSGTVESSS